MKKELLLVALMLGVVAAQAAPSVRPLTINEQATMGATHVVEIEYDDLTTATTNTAQSFTDVFPVKAKYAVECVGAQLVTAFDTGNTNYTGSLTLIVGDGGDDDLYISSMELASDGTEVWWQYNRHNGGTIAVTPTTTTLTYTTNATVTTTPLIYESDGSGTLATTTVVTAWSNLTKDSVVATTATAVFTPTDTLGRKVYTADDYIDFKLTPNAEEAVSANASGKVKIFFKVTDATKANL